MAETSGHYRETDSNCRCRLFLPKLASRPGKSSSFWRRVYNTINPNASTRSPSNCPSDPIVDGEDSIRLKEVFSEDTQTLSKAHLPSEVDDRDKQTPDNWIRRSSALLRLTGNHPFNAEPSISLMYDEGFITPVSLHFVRNHGRTPEVKLVTHTLVIDGLVKRELRLSVDDLKTLPKITMPVSLCCSANRRKEFNAISKTIGFNWTTAANSTNMWTGVRLADVLAKAGVDMTSARFVIFEGVEREALPKGLYATSIDILTALNPFDYVLIAWEQNGIELHPDHGYPLRAIVPGFVGGRSVKWLQRITVSSSSSDNFYHFHDNRIMPSFVDAQKATEEGWWFREEFIYNQLNVNSTIVYPKHEEKLTLPSEAEQFVVKGFALSGGGRKVTRVEVTLDYGKKWRLCDLQYPEEKYSPAPSFGRYYCWMFFAITISVEELIEVARAGGEIRSRAWDSSSNVQPLEHTWNVLGHGNNTQFRLKLKFLQKNGAETIEFLHPVGPGDIMTGWMNIEHEENMEGTESVGVNSAEKEDERIFEEEEVAKHRTEKDCWIVVEGGVYDATSFLKDHPGGATSILLNGGMDASTDFNLIHSDKAKRQLEDFRIGSMRRDHSMLSSSRSGARLQLELQENQSVTALNPTKWLELELISRVDVNKNTRLYTFALQSPQHQLGLPVGYHVFVKAMVDGNPVIRAYTPVSSNEDKGKVVFCIKTYFSGINAGFPNGGKMSLCFEKLKIGEKLAFKGPLGRLEYGGRGKLVINEEEHRVVSDLGMICGGTGITPAYQIMKSIYNDRDDKTVIKLVYANNTEDDILMKDELIKMSERSNIHVWFTLLIADDKWTMDTGFITRSMIAEHIPPPSTKTVIGVCGPPAMINKACLPILTDLDYGSENLVIF